MTSDFQVLFSQVLLLFSELESPLGLDLIVVEWSFVKLVVGVIAVVFDEVAIAVLVAAVVVVVVVVVVIVVVVVVVVVVAAAAVAVVVVVVVVAAVAVVVVIVDDVDDDGGVTVVAFAVGDVAAVVTVVVFVAVQSMEQNLFDSSGSFASFACGPLEPPGSKVPFEDVYD